MVFGPAPQLRKANELAKEWTENHRELPAAWQWLAITQFRAGDYSDCEISIRRAIAARGGMPSIEDEVLVALAARALAKESSRMLVKLALESFAAAKYREPYGDALMQLLENNESPTPTLKSP